MSTKQHVRNRASARPTASGSTRPSAQLRAVVPFIARWSGERDAPMRMVFRRDLRGIAYADERSFDRDEHGILWTRTPSQPGRGAPQFGKIHTLRQRLCMTGLRCQVCGGPADRNPNGILWLIDASFDDLLPADEVTAHPPVCRPCAHQSLAACPHLRTRRVALRVRGFTSYGVTGALYHPTLTGPELLEAATLPHGDPRLRWIRAGQLLTTLTDYTAINLNDPDS